MRKKDLLITPIFIYTSILTIISLLFIISIDYFIYDEVLNLSLYLIYSFIIFISKLLQEKNIYKFAPILLIMVMTLLFWINRPEFTYKQAIEKIQNEKKLEYIHKGITNIKMINSPTVYINKAYVINFKKDGKIIKYIFDPINGEYDVLKVQINGKEGLKEFNEKKNQETIEMVNKAICKLKRSKTKKINFKTVAEEAGI